MWCLADAVPTDFHVRRTGTARPTLYACWDFQIGHAIAMRCDAARQVEEIRSVHAFFTHVTCVGTWKGRGWEKVVSRSGIRVVDFIVLLERRKIRERLLCVVPYRTYPSNSYSLCFRAFVCIGTFIQSSALIHDAERSYKRPYEWLYERFTGRSQAL